MPTQVIMPQLGESVDEGTISKWLKDIGDEVKEFEPLLEVITDKVDTEIPSPAEGTVLAILEAEGTTVNAGTLLAWIGSAGEKIPEGEELPPETLVSTVETISQEPEVYSDPPAHVKMPGRDNDLGFISPIVAKISQEEGVDLKQVQGTGQGGRITKKDVLAYLEQRRQAAPAVRDEIHPVVEVSGGEDLIPTQEAVPGEILPHTIVRRSIAEHMVRSKRTSPHVTTVMEADLFSVVAHRQANKDLFSQDGVNLTFTAYFISATVNALKEYPIVNSSWQDDGILIRKDINIGMATSLGEEGLIVPVIRNADRLSLLGLARAINDLAYRARSHQLKPAEVQGGTFTITNHGTSGSLFASPIINQPQAAILGVGAIQKRVVVINDAIAIRPMVYLSLTFDHRILDGAIGDYFLAKVVESLQAWK
ncbi:MAG: 2-oxo acid dehydrogenase subunit E2 [Chloroflexota bacterium]|nr:MAG: 2-oxo acid dehydrogenase subunit E2 [Chloroflexota bacterium]